MISDRDWHLGTLGCWPLCGVAFVIGGIPAAVRQGEPHYLPHDAAELLVQRTTVVRDAVALTNLAHLARDLGVAVGGYVGREMVLDLEAEVGGEDMAQLPAGAAG